MKPLTENEGETCVAAEIKSSSHHSTEESSLWSGHVSSGTEEMHSSFQSSGQSHGSVPLQAGETLESYFERPTSAPPPGFNTGPEERNRMAEELLWGPKQAEGDVHNTADGALQMGSPLPDQRTSSFSNLAAVLGTGLAESMENSTRERDATAAIAAASLHPKDDLNFHRQTRHAASRLMGASPPKANDPVYAPPSAPPIPTTMPYSKATERTAAAAADDEFRGFPTSLSSPPRNMANEQQLPEKREPSAAGQQRKASQRRGLPLSKDIGMNVIEPEGENQFSGLSGIVSQRMDSNHHHQQHPQFDGMQHIEREMGNLWSSNVREFIPSSQQQIPAVDTSDGGSSISDSLGTGGTDLSPQQAEAELTHFLWDTTIHRNRPSRTIAILHVSWLRAPDVRSACETYGVMETFRAEFGSTKGIYFASYYDIRSAQYAAMELPSVLQRMLILQRSSEEAIVRYCLPLNSSSQFDESQIIISDVPPEVDESVLAAMLTSYGAIRAIVRQGMGSFLVEFQNIQDAKQALLELDSSQPWGPSASVETGVRNPTERKRGRELLAMIGRWRHGMVRQPANQSLNLDAAQYATSAPAGQGGPWREVPGVGAYTASSRQHETMHLLEPDSRYTQAVVQNPVSRYGHPGVQGVEQRQQQVIQLPDGQIYVASVPMHHSATTYVPQHSSLLTTQGGYSGSVSVAEGSRRTTPTTSTPYYTHVITSDGGSLSGRSYRSAQSAAANEEKDNRHLMLDLEAVEKGLDSRTSLMVRNIPNKYTQQMLLSEFQDNGLGPGIIDFFYLPIDFKNRCNRGYAFINFVDYKDILPFHRRYFGKHWRTFNSDKICDITYARIQGKPAMLKRFENSALMEKDDEYKPLVFVSDGPNKGQRLPFPGPSANP